MENTTIKKRQLSSQIEILAFLREHPDSYLEECYGVTLKSYWWWVRNVKRTHEVVYCNGNAARAATRLLVYDGKNGWRLKI